MTLKTLKPRLGLVKTDRIATMKPGSWRTSKTTTGERGYNYRWQQARKAHLREHPICVMCQALDNRVTLATVVDHIVPHRGDEVLFWDRDNWQSLCATHHSSDKQREENGGVARKTIGPDGWSK